MLRTIATQYGLTGKQLYLGVLALKRSTGLGVRGVARSLFRQQR